jgi:hypothetical protein
MTILKELDIEVDKDIDFVESKVVEFYGDLIRASPVDTGEYRGAWEMVQGGKLSWTIENPQQYADVLWRGRRFVGGRWYGSEQWRDGGDPMLDRFVKEIER